MAKLQRRNSIFTLTKISCYNINMNRFSEGDYVRFLNEKQEGVVSRILPNGHIIVDIEDGFPIEVEARELVKVTTTKPASAPASQPTPKPVATPGQSSFTAGDFKIDKQIFLLVAPTANQVSSGPVFVHMVNTTDYKFLFQCSSLQGRKQKGFAAGIIHPGETILLKDIKREAFMEADGYLLEGVLYSDKTHDPLPRINLQFEFPLPNLTQVFPHLSNELAFCKYHTIYNSEVFQEEDVSALYDKLKGEFGQVKINPTRESSKTPVLPKKQPDILKQYGLSPSVIEIDLHIEELHPNIDGMSNAEIIQIQMKHFQFELDKAILRKQKSIVFIHGIGNGRLKSEIRKELKAGGFQFRDGAYERYGAGATEVFI